MVENSATLLQDILVLGQTEHPPVQFINEVSTSE